MINFTPSLAATVAAATKPAAAGAANAETDTGKAPATANATAKPATPDAAGSAAGASDDAPPAQATFQNLLDASAQTAAQAADAQNQPPASPLSLTGPELLASLKAGSNDGSDPAQGAQGQKKGGKTGATPPAATAIDMAALIGAATGQAAVAQTANTAPATSAGSADSTSPLTAALGNAVAAAGGKAQPAANAASAAADGATASPKDFAGLQKTIQENNVLAAPQTVHTERDPVGTSTVATLPVSLTAGGTAQISTTPVAAAHIAVPVGAEGWDKALGQQVVWMVSQKNSTAEIHVNPPNLGPVSVSLNVTDNTASASFVAQHAATREAIADAMPRLRDALAGAGISLGQVSVSAESFAQSGGSGAGAQYTPGNTGGAPAGFATGASISSAAPAPRVSRAQLGLVDTFA